jgi:hypothetical protein
VVPPTPIVPVPAFPPAADALPAIPVVPAAFVPAEAPGVGLPPLSLEPQEKAAIPVKSNMHMPTMFVRIK